jgi:hypothetical protein
VQDKQKLIRSLVIGRRDIRVRAQCLVEDLGHQIFTEVLVILSFEDLVLTKSLLWWDSLIDFFALDHLLDSSELHRSLCILDR